jgi:hypothetical protein
VRRAVEEIGLLGAKHECCRDGHDEMLKEDAAGENEEESCTEKRKEAAVSVADGGGLALSWPLICDSLNISESWGRAAHPAAGTW